MLSGYEYNRENMAKGKKSRRTDKVYFILVSVAIAIIALVIIYSVLTLTDICVLYSGACPEDIVPVDRTNQLLSAEESLAKCLTEKGVVMYGAYWCGHCKNQKEMFGDAFQYVAYVECTENHDICQQKGVTGYPTWIINGESYPGEKPLLTLSGLADCEYG